MIHSAPPDLTLAAAGEASTMRHPRLILLTCLLLAAGCQGAYRDKGNFVPHPAEAAAPGAPGVRTLASVIGIRNPDKDADLPRSVEVRIQIENGGDAPVRLDPASLQLTSGDLQSFGRPITRPADAVTAPTGGAASLTAYFPFPHGAQDSGVDLNGLNLRWSLGPADGDGRGTSQSVTFTRRVTDEQRARSRGPHFGVGFGVGGVIR